MIDECDGSHYLNRVLELLLILSALLTGLTGAFTGDRLQTPAVRSGVEAAASADVEQLAETAATLLQRHSTGTAYAVDGRAKLSWARNPSRARSIVASSERRLE